MVTIGVGHSSARVRRREAASLRLALDGTKVPLDACGIPYTHPRWG